MGTDLAVSNKIASAEFVQKIGDAAWAAIREKEGEENCNTYMKYIAMLDGKEGVQSAKQDAEFFSEEADEDSSGAGLAYTRINNKPNDEVVNAGVKMGEVWYKDAAEGRIVNLGNPVTNVVPLFMHQAGVLFAGDGDEEYKGCKSNDFMVGSTYGDCNTCKFNVFYRAQCTKEGIPCDAVPKDKNNKDAKCQFSNCLWVIQRNNPSKLIQLQFTGLSREYALKKLRPIFRTWENKTGWENGSKVPIWNSFNPRFTIDVKTEKKSYPNSTYQNYYFTEVPRRDEIYPELRTIYRGLSELCMRYYLLRRKAAALKREEDVKKIGGGAPVKQLGAGPAAATSPSSSDHEVPGFKL